jgi:hypothetical protein
MKGSTKGSRVVGVLLMWVALVPGTAWAYGDHSVGFGYSTTHVESEANETYHFHAPALTYSYFRASVVGFLMNVEVFFPVSASQEGEFFHTAQLYRKTLGADLALMFATGFRLAEKFSVQAGVGPHLNAMTLTDKDLVNFQSLTVGIALMATVRWLVHRFIGVGLNVLSAVDFGDLLYDDDGLKWGSHFSVAATVGLYSD